MQPVTDMVCRWDAPGGAGSVFLSASTIRDLRGKAIEAFVSLPKRGVETGGLLFGREQGGHLFIQGSEEVSCEHRYGPSFTLSDADRAHLAGRLAQARRDGSLPVIGFYRSYTGRKGELDTADLALLREHFAQGPFVFLLLQPLTAQICTAGFRLCQDGELLPEPPYTAVSFDPEQFNSAPQAALVETDSRTDFEPARKFDPEPVQEIGQEPALEPVHEPALQAALTSPASTDRDRAIVSPPRLPPPYRSLAVEPSPPETAQPETAAPERPAPTRWWLPVLVVLLSGVGGAVIYEFWTLAHQPQWVELHLDAQRSVDARSLAITWDAAAPKAVSATHALLGITDGSVHLDVPLSQAQVQLGRYLYTPAHPDLELRLILYGKGPALSGGTLRLAPAPRLAQESAASRTAQQSAAPRTAQQSAAPRTAQGDTAPRLAQAPATPPESSQPSPRRDVIHEVQPRISDGIRARLRGPVEIPVEVKIDARGRVIAATTQFTGDGLRKYLAGDAVKAARQWRFAPARTGAPPAEKTIFFTFLR